MKYLLLPCLLFAAGCGSFQEDSLVAQVGSHQIDARLLRLYVSDLTAGLRPQKMGDEARQHYLQALIDRRLLLMEASDRKFDTDDDFQRDLQEVVDARVRGIYRATKITAQAKVSPEEVQDYFVSEGYDRERLLYALKVSSRAAIDTVLQELQAGRSFDEVARARSIGLRSAERGGKLGFIGRDLLESLHIPPEVFNTLPLGQLSEPLPAGSVWHIVRFNEDRPASFEKYKAGIASLLFNKRLAEVENEHLEQLHDTYKVEVHPAALSKIVDAYSKKDPSPLEKDAAVLYSYKGGEVTIGQIQEFLRLRNISYSFRDNIQAEAFLERYFLKILLIQKAAHAGGLYDSDKMKKFKNLKTEDFLLESLRKNVIADLIELSEEEVRHYYDTHPETFRHSASRWIEEVLLPTQSQAQQIKVQIEAGAPFSQFIDKSLRPNALKYKGEFHFHSLGKALYPVLIPAIFEASEEQLVGPLEVKGGFSVFRILRREEPSIEAFETAQRRARALVRLGRETQVLGDLLVQLRQKFAAQTKIYDARLKEALPDSLLEALKLEEQQLASPN
jgi:hypothetical protein